MAELNPIQKNFSLTIDKPITNHLNNSSNKSVSLKNTINIEDYVPSEKLNISLPDIITYFMSSF